MSVTYDKSDAVAPRSTYGSPPLGITVLFSPFSVMMGETVSIVTNEPSAISSFVTRILFPLEFVAVIENVAFPLVSLEKTVVVNVASPPLVAFVNDLPSKVPVKLPRSEPSVSSVTVMVLSAFAKLSSEELAIPRDVTFIGSASIIVMILLTLSPGFPAVSASAVYV